MNTKFSRIDEFVSTLERNELTNEQQAMLLIGTSLVTSNQTGNNCRCGTDNCACQGNNCNCAG